MNIHQQLEYIKLYLGLSVDDLAELLHTNRFDLQEHACINWLPSQQIMLVAKLISVADEFIYHHIVHPERLIKAPVFAGYTPFTLLKTCGTLTPHQIMTLQRLSQYQV